SDQTTVTKNEKHILQIAYFNQYLEPNGKSFPAAGYMMCGAASAVIAANNFHKITYKTGDEHNLKQFMYADPLIDKKGIKCGANKGGAFSYTNLNCNTNYVGGIQAYLKFYGLHA